MKLRQFTEEEFDAILKNNKEEKVQAEMKYPMKYGR